jgi:hypothetical protein
VEQVSKAESTADVSFMERKGLYYMWPFCEDKHNLNINSLLCNIDPPIPVSQKYFKFSKDTLDKVDKIFHHILDL